LIAPVLLILLWPLSPAAAIAVLALSHFLILYPTLRPNVQWLGPVVTRFRTERQELWLTIDDGPTADTRAVLDLFERHGVRATFFVKGTLTEAHPDWTAEILQRGHSLANHTQTHPAGTFWCSLPGRITTEIDGCNHALEVATGSRPRWFRAPVGMKNPAVHPALRRRGMRLIGWTARGFDAVLSDPEEIFARIAPHLVPGGIIVLHQGREYSLRVLERVIVGAIERGFSFTVPDDAQLTS
jgi:peptidoglycan/xylan/chitin deacetylase (PgdA/CDA1 family)